MCFAKSHAALRAHPSWCKVSSCDLSSDFRRARTTLMRRTLLDNTSRWTLVFPEFDLVPSAFGEFDGVFCSQFSLAHVELILSDKKS